MIRLSVAENRIQRVAIKIAQGVFFREHQRYLPRANCKDIRLCEFPEDTPEMYQISWQLSEEQSVCREVFAYRIARNEGRHWLSLLFWEAFMFCMVFDE